MVAKPDRLSQIQKYCILPYTSCLLAISQFLSDAVIYIEFSIDRKIDSTNSIAESKYTVPQETHRDGLHGGI